MSLISRLSENGIGADTPEFLHARLRMANQITLIGFLIASGYALAYAFFFPPLVFYTAGADLAFLLVFALIRLGYHHLARLLLTLAPSVLIAIIQGFAVEAGEPSTPSFVMFTTVMILIPWLLFDYRERILLFVAVGAIIANTMILPVYNRVFESDLDRSLFTHPVFEFILAFSGLITAALLLFLLVFRNFKQEEANTSLLEELEKQKKALDDHQKELETTLSQIEVARSDEQARAWIGSSVGRINDLLREAPTLEALFPPLIKEWVTAVGAFQGVLYIRTQDEKTQEIFLNREATYALSREDELPQRINDGEGQIGIVFVRKQKAILEDLPEDYIHISSGLGSTRPQQVIICPMVTHGQVEGVFEIASIEKLEPAAIQYLEESATIVAATLQNLHTNENTRRLLEVSQQQAEDLRSQEEEMRQNVEELQATQEEMRRKEKDYVNTIQELRNILTEKMYGKK
ncbi:MAG: GAF domain-containing protein [Bacteroidota bacterium]